jgi:predicted transcriptional regulator
MEILIALKETQPISLENLNSKLRLTDPKWLNRQLDKLIKKSLLVRDNSSKQYALTGKGLGIIPNITNNSNSDIKRALSLGYRKW